MDHGHRPEGIREASCNGHVDMATGMCVESVGSDGGTHSLSEAMEVRRSLTCLKKVK